MQKSLVPSRMSQSDDRKNYFQLVPDRVFMTTWAPLHKTFCQTFFFFAIEKLWQIFMQIAMGEQKKLPEFPEFLP